MGSVRSSTIACMIALASAIAVSGCVSAPSSSVKSTSSLADLDLRALSTLAQVAGIELRNEADSFTKTECWLPSDHRIIDEGVGSTTLWRVLCRVYYEDSSGSRYQDTTCIGDFDADPMIEECYRWTPYTDEPAFEDFAAVPAG